MKNNLSDDIQVIGKNTIFSIDYLRNAELTDNDINTILKFGNLTKSLIVGMYRHESIEDSIEDILVEICKDTQWLHNHKWTITRRKAFEKIVSDIYKNIYSYRDNTAKSKAEWFTSIYGFDIKYCQYKKRYPKRFEKKIQ